MLTLKALLLFSIIVLNKAYNRTTFGIQLTVISEKNKEFVNAVIARYASVKHGFVILFVNEIHADYGDYITTTIYNLHSSGYILNFHKNKDAALTVGEKHVKIAVVDPTSELNHVYTIFEKIKVARAKIVVICTEKPHRLLLYIILQAYRNLKCLNGIVVYQHLGQMHVFTVNPFVPEDGFVVKLNSTNELFHNKLKDMMGYKLNALFTYQDRTKANSKRDENNIVYTGKDYDAISTIFTHMNASLNIIDVKDILLENETNPWINSNKHVNRLEVKKRIIRHYNISVVLHSQPFLIEDGITENTYPHTQDDGCILVLKGKELSLADQLLTVFSRKARLFYSISCLVTIMLVVVVGRITGQKRYSYGDIVSEFIRSIVLNNFVKSPKISLHNTILFGLINYCFYVGLFYQSQLTSILTKKSFSKDIDTIQELYDSGQTIYAFANQIEEIKKIYNGTKYSDIADHFSPFPEFTALWELKRDAIYKISVSEEFLEPIVTDHDRALFISRSRTYRKNGRPYYHLMRESILPSYQCYQVEHGSPYLPTVNKLLRYLQEGGILDFWTRQSIYRAVNERLLVPHENYEDVTPSPRTLDLNRFRFAFFVLLSGCAIACIVFALEFIYKYLDDCRYAKMHPFIN